MSNLTSDGTAAINDLARRYGLSTDAVEHMARAVANGGGSMAQFNVSELGGSGQLMMGGMTMVGDMFNNGLQNMVSNLCGELSNAMASTPFFQQPRQGSGGNWWPQWLGQPASSGGQNQTRYAYFPQARRLAFDHGDGRGIVLLDTGDHQIGGFSQQQSGASDPYGGVSLSSQFGQYLLMSFPLANSDGQTTQDIIPQQPVQSAPEPFMQEPSPVQPAPQSANADEIISTIERLAKLHAAGALSDEEFSTKKTDLLSRL